MFVKLLLTLPDMDMASDKELFISPPVIVLLALFTTRTPSVFEFKTLLKN